MLGAWVVDIQSYFCPEESLLCQGVHLAQEWHLIARHHTQPQCQRGSCHLLCQLGEFFGQKLWQGKSSPFAAPRKRPASEQH